MAKKNPKPTPDIEKQELLVEVQTKGYEFIRCNKIKYIGNEYTFIDLRFFQSSEDADGNVTKHPTKKGVQMKEEQFDKIILKYYDHLISQKK